MSEDRPEIRGFLLHVTHYDPVWCKQKDDEKPFDLATALAVVEAAAESGLNMLVIDCADGVRYRTHPELERHYTVPMETLREVLAKASALKLELVPKLNFAQSHHHRHNDWFRPHNGLFDSDEYWRIAFELVDELVEEFKPPATSTSGWTRTIRAPTPSTRARYVASRRGSPRAASGPSSGTTPRTRAAAERTYTQRSAWRRKR